jgi:hypothetical protein
MREAGKQGARERANKGARERANKGARENNLLPEREVFFMPVMLRVCFKDGSSTKRKPSRSG